MFVPMNVTVNVGSGPRTVYSRGVNLLADRLDAFATRLGSFREPLLAIGHRLQERVSGEFSAQGTAAYGKWTQLSEPYGTWKRNRVPAAGILVGIRPVSKGTRQHPTRPQHYVESGRMRRELLDPVAVVADSRRMLYAPVSDIAGYHQTGTSRMPARPLIALLPGELHEWDHIIIGWLNDVQRKADL